MSSDVVNLRLQHTHTDTKAEFAFAITAVLDAYVAKTDLIHGLAADDKK